MAFEISGAVIAEGLVDAALADIAVEAMPLAFDALATVGPEALLGSEALLGGETLSSIFGSEVVPTVLKEAVSPIAQGVIEGGVGAGEGITTLTPGAIETGAAELPAAELPSEYTYTAADTVPDAIPQGEVTYSVENSPANYLPGEEGDIPVNEQGQLLNSAGEVLNQPDSPFLKGIKSVTDWMGNNKFLTGAGLYTLANTTGMLRQKPQTFGQQPSSSNFYNPYKLSPNFQGSHPDPRVYKPSYAGYVGYPSYADGGITQIKPPTPGLMDGNQNANTDFMGKDMYPMSEQNAANYATPSQMPTSAQQTMARYEPNTNPLTGQLSTNMAKGGIAGYADGGTLMQNFMGNISRFLHPVPTEEYLASQGLHTSFNPDYAFDKQNGRFIPMSSLNIPQQSGIAAAGDFSFGGDGGGGGGDGGDGGGGGGDGGGGGGEKAGGIVGYYRGDLATSTGGRGDVYSATQRFMEMYDPYSRYQAPTDASRPDVGIFHDTSPSTRDKSALEAAQIRQKAINRRSQVNTGAKYAQPSVAIGKINLGTNKDNDADYDQVLAASGGIMGYNLGGYAAGGNPRLLRGPGDGMSDDIPATIGNRQPARLADGEFVVPADVVSGLGNGSTEAGAKKLHEMMDKVRIDRTGKKKQAPAIKSGKYIPK